MINSKFTSVRCEIKSVQNSHYRIVGLAGEGQFGKVYAAIHRQTGELVALKELNPFKFSTKKFLREIRILLSLDHPNIIRCYGVEHYQDKRYLVTEYCDGGTLRDLLATNNNRVNIEYKLKIIIDILEGLSHAHKEGIIHRDLKPENILLSVTSQGWKAKISDFGIAKIEVEDAIANISNMGDTGSPAYMAPEQFYGKYSYGSDIYSVGIILYELITGVRPFSGTPSEIMFAHLNRQPKFPKNLSPNLRLILREALQKLPQHRFRTASEMKAQILQCVLDLENKDVGFYEEIRKKPLYLELIQEELNDKENIICLKTQGNLLYQTSAKKVTVKTFNFHHQKVNFCFKNNYLFPENIIDLKIINNGCVVVTKDGKERDVYKLHLCQDKKRSLIHIKSDYFHYGIDSNCRWFAVTKTEGNEQGFQIIKTQDLSPITPLITDFIPSEIIILDSCHGIVIYTQNDIDKNRTYFRLFNRRGVWYDTYTVFLPLRRIVYHSRHSKTLLAGERKTNNLILLKFYPFSVKRIPLHFYPDFYYPMTTGFICASTSGNVALLDLEGNLLGLSHFQHNIRAIASLNEDTIITITGDNSEQKQLIYRFKTIKNNKVIPINFS
ncbi:serine/threonine protein kinase [Cyanobacterium aponinum IPPAS B-1201]|nr:serine/threonine protein kinase [Cyanobacterium aponinum IPPAS B-1201]